MLFDHSSLHTPFFGRSVSVSFRSRFVVKICVFVSPRIDSRCLPSPFHFASYTPSLSRSRSRSLLRLFIFCCCFSFSSKADRDRVVILFVSRSFLPSVLLSATGQPAMLFHPPQSLLLRITLCICDDGVDGPPPPPVG